MFRTGSNSNSGSSNPVRTLKRPFHTPGYAPSPAGGSALNTGVYGARLGSGSVETRSPYFEGNGAYKRPKTGSTSAHQVYGDDETTGFEDDGSESPWIQLPPSRSRPGLNPTTTAKHGLTPLGLKDRAVNTPSAHNHGSPASKTLYYQVQWRKPSTKKHKTWEGDGMLIVTNGRGVLKDKDTCKDIGSGVVTNGGHLQADQEITLGGKEVLVDCSVSAAVFLDGSFFGKNAISISSESDPKVASASTPIASFYGPKPTIKKFHPPGLSSGRSAYGKSLVGMPLPPKVRPSESDENLSPARAVFPGQAYKPLATTSKTATASAGTKRPDPKGLFDPDAPKAVVMRRPDEGHRKTHNPHGYPVVDVVVDPCIGNKLREHQKEGVRFMYECVTGMKGDGKGCILADDMGLGKTIQSIALVLTLLKQNPYFNHTPGRPRAAIVQKVVIACPVTLVKNWGKEFRKWLGRGTGIESRINVHMAEGKDKNDLAKFKANPHCHVLIIGYEKLRTVVAQLKGMQPPIGLMICDEGHRLRSAGAKTTQALKELNIERRIILSGTPIQNELQEFHSMVDFVNPGQLDTYQNFKRQFEGPILKSREPNCSSDAKELGEARAEGLARITHRFVLRRTADIIAGYLPPKSEYVVFVAPTPLQIEIYEKIVGSRATAQAVQGGGPSLALITILKKLCNTPGLLLKDHQEGKTENPSDGNLIDSLIKLFPVGATIHDVRLSGKLRAVEKILRSLKEETDEKIVLVSNYTSTLDVLEQMCLKRRYPFCRLDGKTKQGDRQQIVDTFNQEPQHRQFVFLLSSKSGGTGLNIVGASRLVLFDSDWNPSNDLQAMARIHRDGQKKPCVIYRILTCGTMDEKIFQRQITKTGLAGSLIDDTATIGGGGSKKDAFTAKDLRDIFALHTDTPCQTHDLLGCECSPTGAVADDVEEGEDAIPALPSDTESDEDDGLPEIEAAFVPASQYKPAKEKSAKAGKNLAALKEWTHINCSVDDDAVLDNIEDEVLREAVTVGFELMRVAARPAERSFSMDLADDDEESDMSRESEKSKGKMLTFQGGEISYVFHKKVAPKTAK